MNSELLIGEEDEDGDVDLSEPKDVIKLDTDEYDDDFLNSVGLGYMKQIETGNKNKLVESAKEVDFIDPKTTFVSSKAAAVCLPRKLL